MSKSVAGFFDTYGEAADVAHDLEVLAPVRRFAAQLIWL